MPRKGAFPVTHMLQLASLYSDLDASLEGLQRDSSRVDASRDVVEAALAEGGTHYGINTGFGALARQRIPAEDVARLQRNLVLSHAVGVGPLVPRPIAELMLRLKVHALGLGHSGVSRTTFDRLVLFAAEGMIPAMPSRGSLGASGDLAPLAHMALPLLGRGQFWNADGKATRPAAQVLAERGLELIELQAKDGLALINGTQMMSAYGAFVLERAMRLAKTADLLAAMSLEALQGSLTPFDARIQEIRPHPGQKKVAENVRRLLVESEILEGHRDCGKVQDPYSLRCVPQVHGACRDALQHACDVVEREINSVTDNPLVFDSEPAIVSGGNFHGEPLALAMDYAAMALAEFAGISERRTYLLLEGNDGLPTFLMQNTGINSGYMMPQYTAASLVSENKVLCHPASVDSIPSSRGQEDHVSMGSISAVKLLQVMENVERVLGVELMTAAQALDYRRPLKPGRGVALAHEMAREAVPHREEDGDFSEDLGKCIDLVATGSLLPKVEEVVGALG